MKGNLILKYTGVDITQSEYDLASEVLYNQMIDREVLNRYVPKIIVAENETLEITYKFSLGNIAVTVTEYM